MDNKPQLISRMRKHEHPTTFPDTEEVNGSNPVRPTSKDVLSGPSFLVFVRHRCVVAPSPGLHHLVVRVRREVGIPLSCSVALVAEEGCYRPRYLNIQRLNYLWTIRHSSTRIAGDLIT